MVSHKVIGDLADGCLILLRDEADCYLLSPSKGEIV